MKSPVRNRFRRATLAKLKSGGYVIKVTFPYFADDVTNVKEIPGRKFYPNLKVWTVPLNMQSIEKLDEFGFELEPRLHQYARDHTISINELAIADVPGLRMQLYKYQGQGVTFIDQKEGRALIGDEMGLGKTAQALAWTQLHWQKKPVLIVVPASLKYNWSREIRMWLPPQNVYILSGKNPHENFYQMPEFIDQERRAHNLPHNREPSDIDYVIINYDILGAWFQILSGIQFQILIGDEIHYIKNNKTQRTRSMKRLVKRIPHFIALSGTPIVNKPIEFYNAIQMIDKGLFPNYWNYVFRYCDGKGTGFGIDSGGASNTEELHQVLTQAIMIRRLKKDVLKDLPDKTHSFIPMEMQGMAEKQYWDAEQDFIQWARRVKGEGAADRARNAETLAKIEALKQLAVKAKFKNSILFIENFLESDSKLVVFTTHQFTVDGLMKHFGRKAVKVDGSVKGHQREIAVDMFWNDDNVRLFVGNIKAAGVGLNLQVASNVAFLELPWTPGELVQAEDRCHRIGQKDAVNVHYLLARGTIEEKIAQLLDEKRKVLDSVLDGIQTEDTGLLTKLMEEY